MNSKSTYAGLRIVAVVESALVLLDIGDTLRAIGVGLVRETASPVQAVALLDREEFDAAIVGIAENTAKAQMLFAALAARRIPIVRVGIGTEPQRDEGVETSGVNIPFDTAAIAAALDKVLGRT